MERKVVWWSVPIVPGLDFVPDGNSLILSHKDKYVPEISDVELQDEVIYEVDFDGRFTGFEWQGADHINEFGFDESALAAIYQNPSIQETGVGDWLHINSISYLGENRWFDAGDERFRPDNIILDSRNASFLAIISKETGAVVWRVGPDFSEGTPEHDLGQFQGQHHVHMIPRGLPGEGNILLFDNGGESVYGPDGYPEYGQRGWSRVVEFDPTSLQIVWQYGQPEGEEFFFSPYISSAQRLPNGNTLITIGLSQRAIEVTSDNRIVWDFTLPNAWWVYRSYRIPPEWLPGNMNVGGYPFWSTMFE